MHYHFVVNPAAGRGQAGPLAEALVQALRAAGAAGSLYITTAAGDAAAHVRSLEVDALDRLIVIGGDGTLREVVNALPPPIPWPVGIVPMGTANVVGRELRMPLDHQAPALVHALLHAKPWPVDVLRITHPDGTVEHAVANTGVGLDAEVVHAVSRVRAGGAGGYLRWMRPILDSLSSFRFPPLRVTLDERVTYAAGACIVQNARNYGGVFELAPGAALDSGALDVMLVRTRTHRGLFGILFSALMRRAERNHDVKFVRATHVRLRSATRVPVQADGDPAGWTDVQIEVVPGALTLLRAP
ncbi:MAG: diacylglycerol kinase family lipid kinase [Planctomycetota bacterium]|nr:diacylglycerol kinase family lipid kinase [Planctomycetota bacterium]